MNGRNGPERVQQTALEPGTAGAAAPGPAGGRPAVRVAAIDCGTNSLRLLIADVDPVRGTLTDLSRRMEIVRLGQGVDATGRLAADALDRTFLVLADYAREIESASAGAVRMVATSATRDAVNAGEFVRGVTAILGRAPEVLSGGQEARLGFIGATAEFRPGPAGKSGPDSGRGRDGGSGLDGGPGQAPLAPPYLVADIGGGSTEFVVGGNGAGSEDRLAAVSVDIGCVRLTERHLHSDPPSAGEIAAATADVDAALTEVAARLPVASARTLLGLAGSVTTVTAIALGLDSYDPARIHHARIPASAVSAVTAELLRMSRLERASISVMHPGRADVIGGGALVLDRIVRRFGFAEVVASEHDILDGLAWSLAGPGPRP